MKKLNIPSGAAGVVIRGEHSAGLVGRLRARGIDVQELSVESLQQDEEFKRDALLSLFPVKPKQTGFTSLGELKKSATINGPGTVAVVDTDELVGYGRSLENDIELDAILDEIEVLGSQTTDTDNLVDVLADKHESDSGFVYYKAK